MYKENNQKIKFPLVSILLAVYDPNYIWLIKQLESLNNQSYSNLELIIYDDCPENPLDEKVVEKYINNFNYEIIKGNVNLGSNRVFEELTRIAQGEYFAYCDQDDVWEADKIEVLLNLIKKEKSVLAYSDMSVIDEDGKHTADTLIKVKTRIRYIYGKNLFSIFFFKNCVSGCCMLIDSGMAKKALPFSKVTIHDQWLCMIASYYGKISFINKPLVNYRIHGNNQTGSFRGIYTKSDYYNLRINTLKQRIYEIKECIGNINLGDIEEFCNARINKDILKIAKYGYLNKKEAYFEIAIKYMPNWLFKIIIKKLK